MTDARAKALHGHFEIMKLARKYLGKWRLPVKNVIKLSEWSLQRLRCNSGVHLTAPSSRGFTQTRNKVLLRFWIHFKPFTHQLELLLQKYLKLWHHISSFRFLFSLITKAYFCNHWIVLIIDSIPFIAIFLLHACYSSL